MTDPFNKAQILAIETSDRKYVRAKKIYIDMINNLQAGMVLSEVVYWHLPGKTGKSRLLLKNGEQWLATRRKSWWDRSRLTEREFDRALDKLVKAKLIIREYFVYNDQMTPHLRINWPVFEERYNQLMSNMPERATKRRIIMKGINDIWWFLLEILKGGYNQLVIPEGVLPIGYTPLPIGYSVSPDGETVILFGEAYTTYTTHTNPIPENKANTNTPAPNGASSALAVIPQPLEKSSLTEEPPEKLEFDMTILFDVVAHVAFKYNQPKQLKAKSNQRNVKRIDVIVGIVTEDFPTFSDSQLAAIALRFYRYWSAKIINGTRASIPLNADTFGNRWREWLETQADLMSIKRIQTPTANTPPGSAPPPIDDEPPPPALPAFSLVAASVPDVFGNHWKRGHEMLRQQLPGDVFYPWIAEAQLAASDGVTYWFMAKSKTQVDKLSGLSREIKRVLRDVTGSAQIELKFDVAVAIPEAA